MLLGISDMAGKYYFPAIGSFLIYLGDDQPADVAAGRHLRSAHATAVYPSDAGPQAYLQSQVRWRTAEIAVLARDPAAVRGCCRTILSLASQIAITALFALSLDLILGYAGIVSLGHAAFFGFGAYAAGLISKHGWGEPLSGLVLSGIAAGPPRLRRELRHLRASGTSR